MRTLTKAELSKVKVILDSIEVEAWSQVRHLNGSFASAEMYDYDSDTIDVKLEFGYEGMTYDECLSIDRETMKVIN